MAVEFGAVPATLRQEPTWVCWRYQFDTDRNEWTKVPIDASTGNYAKSTDPDTWATFEDAVAHHKRDNTDGIGYVVHDNNTVVGVDLDDCRDTETGTVKAWAGRVAAEIETYIEVSPSGTGLRLFGLGFVPDDGTRGDIEDTDGHIEMYDTARDLTVTGAALDDAPDDVRQVNDAVADIHAKHIADDGDNSGTTVENGGGVTGHRFIIHGSES